MDTPVPVPPVLDMFWSWYGLLPLRSGVPLTITAPSNHIPCARLGAFLGILLVGGLNQWLASSYNVPLLIAR